ncbi:hypothetical protein GPALN_010374 [Globodera pallida]|nr:hypothetical protein GPALN_010374 [Globodera pallida]
MMLTMAADSCLSTLEEIAKANKKNYKAGSSSWSGRSTTGLWKNCKSQQEELQSRIKQLEREKHNSMAVALISDRSDALEDFGRIAKANKKNYKAGSNVSRCLRSCRSFS